MHISPYRWVSLAAILACCLIWLPCLGQLLKPLAVLTVDGRRLVNSANGLGFPVLQLDDFDVRHPRMRWLDPQQARFAGLFAMTFADPIVSASGRMMVAREMNPIIPAIRKTDMRVIKIDIAGNISHLTVPEGDLLIVADAGTFSIRMYHDNQRCCIINSDGNVVLGPEISGTNQFYYPADYLSADNRYQVFYSMTHNTIVLFDVHECHISHVITDAPVISSSGMLFHADDRFLLVPRQGQALVFSENKQLGTVGDDNTYWRWGEDGSAWVLNCDSLNILNWRIGNPHFISIPVPQHHDEWVGDIHQRALSEDDFHWSFGSAWGAIWQDGVMIAHADMVNATTRRLSLYRGGELVGIYSLPWKTPTNKEIQEFKKYQGESSAGPPNYSHDGVNCSRERVTFTADGSRLAWIVDDGKGPMKIYLFETGWQVPTGAKGSPH